MGQADSLLLVTDQILKLGLGTSMGKKKEKEKKRIKKILCYLLFAQNSLLLESDHGYACFSSEAVITSISNAQSNLRTALCVNADDKCHFVQNTGRHYSATVWLKPVQVGA